MKTLIAYATKYGCTEKCAKMLSEKLEGAQLCNLKVNKVSDISQYDRVIIGGSIHMGRIQKKVSEFCKKNLNVLKDKRLGLFICCMREENTAQEELNSSFPQELLSCAVTKECFGGEFIFSKMNFLDIIFFCTLIVIYGIVVILLSGGNTSMRKMFLSEVQTELDKSKVTNEVFTEEDISNLPEPVQRYFRYCGYIGKEKMTNAKFVWDDVNFKMSPDKPWFKIKYEQYNFVSEPSRFAYIYSKMFGVIPFEGRDKFLDGKGNMIGRLAKIKTVFDVTGAEMDVSAAVTYLSESLIVPACALQKYIRWEAIDQNYAKASIEYIGTKAEGIFTFNDKGEFTDVPGIL